MMWAQGMELLQPDHGAEVVVWIDGKKRERGSPAQLACPPVCLMQPLLKIELCFAKRVSNDTHQVPINSSKW